MRQIDLKNFQIRTDLVTEILSESDKIDGIKQEIKKLTKLLPIIEIGKISLGK